MKLLKHITGEPIYVIIPMPIYKNECEYLKMNGYEAFMDEYQTQVSEDEKYNFDI